MSFQMGFTLVFLTVLIFSYLGTGWWWRYTKAKDKPSERKVHQTPIVTMGGVVIFVFYWLAVIFLTVTFRLVIREQLPLFIASLPVFITGVYDDAYEISPIYKSVGILIGATIIYFTTEFRIYSVFVEWFDNPLLAELVGYGTTVVWIYFVTNAFNLIDGLDGLSTGVSIIALATLSFVSYFFSPISVFILTMMVLLLIATLLGFLPHNYHPARLFIGDTGALFMGFMTSVFCLMGIQRPGYVSVAIPIIIIGLPLTDAICAIIRRLLKGQSITKADRLHMHHKFLKKGTTHSRTVLTMYGIAMCFAGAAILLSLVETKIDRQIILGLSVIGEFLLIDYLNLLDLKKPLIFRNHKWHDEDR
ncbi:undecaprenyl/decaprenyl-phosphate alpha-N-acetylglucosaminyl 1-phosphate transferase [Carnobacteriaceae bacterium zg-ZUI240]|nr:undecaprenyl/decaprenyl-phosphate alpha-N-acetylglucosaminyl 1-phosphate transferase [Carnobacteriaceae bacterium zg-ZUI240]